MYSELVNKPVFISYEFHQGGCLGYYIHEGYMGIQVEDDGTWFNALGPIPYSLGSTLLSLISKLSVNGTLGVVEGVFEGSINDDLFEIKVRDKYQGSVKEIYRVDQDIIGLEFKPGFTAHVNWLSDLTNQVDRLRLMLSI